MKHKATRERAERTGVVTRALDIKRDQGWTDDTFSGVMWEFILMSKRRREHFIKYLHQVQYDENAGV